MCVQEDKSLVKVKAKSDDILDVAESHVHNLIIP